MPEQTHLHDEHGNPVASDQRPPDVDTLPFLESGALPSPPPAGIEARVLRGNWFGRGQEVVLWHPQSQKWTQFPLNDADRCYDVALYNLLSALGLTTAAVGHA